MMPQRGATRPSLVESSRDIKPIKTHRDHRRVLEEIEGLMNAKRNTPEGDRLDVLVTLVEAWEAKRSTAPQAR